MSRTAATIMIVTDVESQEGSITYGVLLFLIIKHFLCKLLCVIYLIYKLFPV